MRWGMWGRARGALVAPVGQCGGICGQSIPRSLCLGLLMEPLTCLVGSTSLLLCSAPRSGCWSPSHSPPPGFAAHDSVFWTGLLWQCVTQLGKLGVPSPALTLPRGGSHWLRSVLLVLSCAALKGWVKRVKSNCASYPFRCILPQISFVPLVGWNFSTGLLDFHKGSLICG